MFCKPKIKHVKSSIYYSDFARFEHDPPGHTCGLPCCREDANVHIKQPSSGYSCMPVYQKILEDNFTFRTKRYGLISGRPTFSNRFFSLQNINSDEIARQRRPIPDFHKVLELDESPKSLEVVLTDNLENPFALMTRPGLRKGDFMCRREICLPDSPENARKFIFPEEIGESLDFDDEEDGTIEYYTTTPQNLVRVDTATVKIVNKVDHGDLGFQGCHDNKGYTHDDVSDTVASSDHYYDVLNVVNKGRENLDPSPTRLYPDLSELKDQNNTEELSFFKRKYVNTLARKKTEPKPVPAPKRPEKYNSFPCRKNFPIPIKVETVEDKLKRFHLWNQYEPAIDNYYEDIEFKLPETKGPSDAVKNDVKKADDVRNENSRNSFGSFGYEGDKIPAKPDKDLEKLEIKKEMSKRQDSLKESPITLIL